MKHLLLTTIAAVMLVGCGESQSPAKAPDISIHGAATVRNIKAVKQHLAAGMDVEAKGAAPIPSLNSIGSSAMAHTIPLPLGQRRSHVKTAGMNVVSV